MASLVDVWNMSLALLAQDEEILNPDDKSTKAGRLCNRFWPQVRDEVLAAEAWGSASKRVELTSSGNPVAFQASNKVRYTLPADCVRLISLTTDGEQEGEPVPYEIEQRDLLTIVKPPLLLRFVSKDVPVSNWEAHLVHAAANRLSTFLAIPLTGKNSERERMKQGYQEALSMAKISEAKNSTPPAQSWGSWNDARSE